MILKDKPLILASSSKYRRELLSRLRLPFESISPDIDERPLPGEPPSGTASRLAREKARAVGAGRASALVIGSDQVASLDGAPLDKPLTHERAARQLAAMSGREATFHTGLCLLDVASGRCRETVVPYVVRLRALTPDQIERYLRAETPYDCAGSAKVESLGIALLEWMRGDDPTALVGLPLIALTGMLAAEGVALP
jgi:septum formation protein